MPTASGLNGRLVLGWIGHGALKVPADQIQGRGYSIICNRNDWAFVGQSIIGRLRADAGTHLGEGIRYEIRAAGPFDVQEAHERYEVSWYRDPKMDFWTPSAEELEWIMYEREGFAGDDPAFTQPYRLLAREVS